MNPNTKKLHKLCDTAGLRLEICSDEGHYKIIGETIVNYWPESKLRTAHVVGRKAERHVTPEAAVFMAGKPPKEVSPSATEGYTRRTNLPPDRDLMNVANEMKKKHGL